MGEWEWGGKDGNGEANDSKMLSEVAREALDLTATSVTSERLFLLSRRQHNAGQTGADVRSGVRGACDNRVQHSHM